MVPLLFIPELRNLSFTEQILSIGAVLVMVLGLVMLSQGSSLSGWLPPGLLLVLLISLCVCGTLLRSEPTAGVFAPHDFRMDDYGYAPFSSNTAIQRVRI